MRCVPRMRVCVCAYRAQDEDGVMMDSAALLEAQLQLLEREAAGRDRQ